MMPIKSCPPQAEDAATLQQLNAINEHSFDVTTWFLTFENWRNYLRECCGNNVDDKIIDDNNQTKKKSQETRFMNNSMVKDIKLPKFTLMSSRPTETTKMTRTKVAKTISTIKRTNTTTKAKQTPNEIKTKMQRNHLQKNEIQMMMMTAATASATTDAAADSSNQTNAKRANNATCQQQQHSTKKNTSTLNASINRNLTKASSLITSSALQSSQTLNSTTSSRAQLQTSILQQSAAALQSLTSSSWLAISKSSSSLNSPATIYSNSSITSSGSNNNNSNICKLNVNPTPKSKFFISKTAKWTTSTSASAAAFNWFLPIFCLVTLLGTGQAGFACLSNPCVFGVCIDGLNSSYSCYCIDGYTGIQCQTNWDECWSGPCQNGGTCVDGVAYYNCTCPDGFSGPNCEENVDECMSNPCQNGGHCRDRNNGYTCTCQPGYLGTHCEVDVAVCDTGTGARCQNGGECVEGPGLEFSCECTAGWKGRICQEEINECESSPCQNGGVCVDKLASYACACPMGYTGTNCEEEILICADNPCQNNALCLMEEGVPTCYCVPDYHGEKCEYQYDECQLGPRCMNGGVCIDGVDTFSCSCPPMLTGMLCECLMIGVDSLDCNYTAPSTVAPPVTAKPIPATALTPREEPPVATTKATSITSAGVSVEGGVSQPETGTSDESGGVGGGDGAGGGSASKPETGTSIKSSEVTKPASGEGGEVGTTPISMPPSVGVSVEDSGSAITTEPAIVPPVGTGSNLEGKVSVENFSGGGSGSAGESSEITTVSRFDISSGSQETTTTPKSIKTTIDVDYTPTSSQSKDYTSGESGELLPSLPRTTSRPTYTHIVTTVETSITFDYSTPRPGWRTPPPPSVESSEETLHTTLAPKAAQPPIHTTAPSLPEAVTTATAPFFTESPETHVTTRRLPPKTPFEPDQMTATPISRTEPPIIPTDGSAVATTPAQTVSVITTHEYTHPIATTPPTPPIIEITTSQPISTDDLVSHMPPEVVTTEMPLTPTAPVTSAATVTLSPAEKPVITYVPPTMHPTPVQPETEPTMPPQPPVQATTTTSTTSVITTARPVVIAGSDEDSGEATNTIGPPVVTTALNGGGGSAVGGGVDNATDADCLKSGCYNGGTCVTTSEGSRCVCRFDRQGALCESPIIIKNAAFSGDSYVSHRIHKDIPNHESLDSVLPMHVQLKVRTRATNGLIMLAAAQGTKGGHYMALFLQKGLLQFQFSCGLQTMLLSELETPVNTGHEITIRAELDFSRNYTHCNASLLVNDTLAMSGDQPTWLKLLPARLHTPDSILNTWLHLGGAPQAPIGLIIELPPAQSGTGFTGCLHSLRINDESREIFGDALDGFGISECGSLACLSSPCRNGAACIKIESNEVDENGEKAEKWKCKCPTGYMGPTCEISVCEDNPCQYGGTCVQFPGSGYLCLCPLGKHGHYCEHNLEVALPSFSGSVNGLSSYVAYTVPIPLEYSIELSFKILPQTMSQIALLAFLGQSGFHDEKSDHLAVSFIQGYIMLTWNLGGGPRRIFTQKPIDFRLDAPRVPYEIKVGRIGRQAWLSVDGKYNITGRSPGSVNRMDVMPILYLGGHEISNFNTLPHDLPLHSGFQGCIYDVHLKAGQVTVPLQETRGVRGRGVGQCGTRECHRHACQHDGACLQHGATFTCICQEGWYGPLCAQPKNPCDSFNNKCSEDSTCVPLVNGYECDCPVGKTGKNCEEEINSLSDVSLTGRRSYLAVTWPYLYDKTDKLGSKRSQIISYRNFTKKLMPPKPISSPSQHFVMKLLNEVEKSRSFSPVPLMGSKSFEEHHRVQFFFIEFQIRPLSERGLLLYFGTLNNNQDKKVGFVSLSLQGGVVEFRISGPNSHVTVVRSVRMLAIGEWHKIKMAQRGRWLTLWVEGSASSALAPSAEVLVEPDSLLYIGGLKDLSKLPYNAISGFPIPFRGCVRGLVVSGTRIVLNVTNIMEARNIRDCDGTACGGDSCESGGHCWLDEKLQPHCICPEYAKGDRCEYSETCKLIPCRNNGRCLRSGRCSCPNGWGGFYCEIAMSKPTTPSFRGNSYLILPPPRIPIKDKRKGPSLYVRPRDAMQISLNFSTIEPDGLLLWSEHDRNKFLGLGLENGHLKIASNLLGSNNDTVAAPLSGFIADGGWHLAKVILDRSRLELQLDGEVIFTEKLAESNLLAMPPTPTQTTTASSVLTLPRHPSTMRRSKSGVATRSMTPTSTTTLMAARKAAAAAAANTELSSISVTYEDVFYLGGFPNMESVSRRTQGRFDLPFKGCLQDIQFGVEPNAVINDFSSYQGENIGSCDLHGDEPLMIVV